jgi:hypothetical protein
MSDQINGAASQGIVRFQIEQSFFRIKPEYLLVTINHNKYLQKHKEFTSIDIYLNIFVRLP